MTAARCCCNTAAHKGLAPTCVQDGGAIYARAQASIYSANCTSSNNTAKQQGGWLSCSGCAKVAVKSHSSQVDTAGAAGGAIACNGCMQLLLQQSRFAACTAGEGGAVAALSTGRVNTGCNFTDTASVPGRSKCSIQGNAVVQAQRRRLASVPALWRGLYSGAASLACGGTGAGGALQLEGAQSASMNDTSFVNSTAVLGGAVSAACAAAQQASLHGEHQAPCMLSVGQASAAGNAARQAGGVLFTDNTVNKFDSAPASRQRMLELWARSNTITQQGGFGAGAASTPSTLSLLGPSSGGAGQQQQGGQDVAAAVAAPLRSPGRRLLALRVFRAVSSSMQNTLSLFTSPSIEGFGMSASAEDAYGKCVVHL